MFLFSQGLKTLSAIACLVALCPAALAVQISQATVPAVIPLEGSATACATEQAQFGRIALDGLIDRARQNLNDRQPEAAANALTQALGAIAQAEDVSTKITLLDQTVNSDDYTSDRSLLEQLVNQATPTQRSQIIAILSQAERVAQSLSSGYSAAKTRTLTSIARYYGVLEEPQQAQTVLDEALQASQSIRGEEIQAKALTDIAKVYTSLRQPQAAASVLAQAFQFAQAATYPNDYRKAETLEPIAQLYAQIGEPDRALQVAQQIENAPYYQSAAMVAVADQYVQAGQFDRAIAIASNVSEGDQRTPILGVIAAGYAKAGQLDRAADFLGQALNPGDRTGTALAEWQQTVVPIVMKYAAAGQTDAALRVLGDFDDAAAKATGYGEIALLYAEAGQTERTQATLAQALQNLGAIADPGHRSSITQQLIDRSAQSGRYDLAVQVAQAGKTEDSDYDYSHELTGLADQAIAANQYDGALEVTKAIPESFIGDRSPLVLKVVRSLAEAGDFDRAQDIVQQNADLGLSAQAFAIISAQMQLANPQSDSATELFDQAVQIANASDSPYTKADILRTIASEQLKSNHPEAATQLLNQVVEWVKTIEDEETRLSTLQSISAQLSEANQYQAAIQVADAIVDAPVRRSASIADAITSAIASDDVTTALATLSSLDDPITKTTLLIAVADRYMQLGQRSQSASSLDQAFQMAKTIPGDESQSIIVRASTRDDESPIVMEDDRDRGSFFEAIALKYAQIGQEQQSLQVAQALQDPVSRDALILRLRCYGVTPNGTADPKDQG